MLKVKHLTNSSTIIPTSTPPTTGTTTVRGWLFDVYPDGDKMVFWIKNEKDGKNIKLVDNSWSHSIYVASDNREELASLLSPSVNRISSALIKRYGIVQKYERQTIIRLMF